MPPKKKCTHKAGKAELIFLERPREGPIQCYETPLHSAENPRRAPAKPVDQNTSTAWVGRDYPSPCVPQQRLSGFSRMSRQKALCSTESARIGKACPTCSPKPGSHSLKVCPQFETTNSVVLKACQKKHCGPRKPQDQDANHSLLCAGGACRRAAVRKLPPLTFENPEGYAVHPSDHPSRSRKNTQHSHSQPKKGTAATADIQVKSLGSCREILSSPAPQPVEPEVFTPDAPQVPSVRNWRCSSSAWHPETELASGTDPCESREAAAVLVTDTPEHEYGVKVTWRQRPHLMKYLQERGKLSAADILVKVNPELSRRQANV